MITHYVLAGITLFGIFVLFLVLSKTLNTIILQLNKLLYLLQREHELRKEILAIRKLFEVEAAHEEAKIRARAEAELSDT